MNTQSSRGPEEIPPEPEYFEPPNGRMTISGLRGMLLPSRQLVSRVRYAADGHSRNIAANYQRLNSILARHEAVIQKRWNKKTLKKRVEFLLAAWPGMPSMHRPDIHALRQGCGEHTPANAQHQDHVMWPYINQQDLSNPGTLLLLLNARGRNSPCEFAASDWESLYFGQVYLVVPRILVNGHTMMLRGVTNPEEYGQICAWEDDMNNMHELRLRQQFIVGEGFYVLQAQDQLLAFLVTCCEKLLHDIPADTLTSEAYPLQPEPALKSGDAEDGVVSLAVMTEEAPYKVPAQGDLGRIESLLRAKANEVDDDMLALQEDPGHFAENAYELKRRYELEMLANLDSSMWATLTPSDEDKLWARALCHLVCESYFELDLYTELHRQAQQLRELQVQYDAALLLPHDLPEEVESRIFRFYTYLEQAAKRLTGQLLPSFHPYPPESSYSILQPVVPCIARMRSVTRRVGKVGKPDPVLAGLLHVLSREGDHGMESLPMVLDEVVRMVAAEPEASPLLSRNVDGIIGKLSIISQCLTQLGDCLPWTLSLEAEICAMKDGFVQEYKKRREPLGKVQAAINQVRTLELAKLVKPPQRYFPYPTEKKRTRENTEILRNSERNLDNFWNCVNRLVRAECKGSENAPALQVVMMDRALNRTAEWVESGEPSSTGRGTAKKRSDAAGTQDPINKSMYALRIDTSSDHDKPLSGREIASASPASGSKTKTKGVPFQNTTPETPQRTPATAAGNDNDNDNDTPVVFRVNARAHRVFRALFHDPEATGTPGEVAWGDFVHAMTSTGLFSAQKLYGSVWQFERTGG